MGNEVVPPGYQAAYTSAALFGHSDATRIELAGPEARIFLHNLCTQDVKNLAEFGGAETFLTTAKARVVAHGAVSRVRWQGQDVLWFDTAPDQAERVLSHLNHFLISEQVELSDRSMEVGMFRLVGPAAAAILTSTIGKDVAALAPWQSVAGSFMDSDAIGDVIVRRHAGLNLSAYDLFCVDHWTPSIAHSLIAAGAELTNSDKTHELLRVEAGWPVQGADMDENRFVVEVGRTAQAICYTKGCFLGQEPIVMARDRGQVNRMLMGVMCGDGPALAAGTKLFQGEAEVGQVTSSVVSPRLGQSIALAYIKRGSQAPGTALTVEPASGGRQAVVCALPFVGQTRS